jgi:zinc protease
MINRNIAPPFKIPKGFPLQKPEFIQLKGGLHLYYLFNDTFPTLKIDFVFRAGKWFEPRPGIAMLCSKMLTEGTKKLSSYEIAAQLDQYGTFTQAESGSDYLLFSAYLLRKHAEKILPVLYELIYGSCFPENETENAKNVQIQNLKVNLSKNSYLAGVYFKNQLFGNAHPYGKITTEDDIFSANNLQLVNFHAHSMLDNFDIIISGMIDDHLLKYIESLFGSKGQRNRQIVQSSLNDIGYAPQTRRVKRDESLQCSIRMGKPIIDKSHPDYPALEIYNEILGGYFGSRLMQNIREEKVIPTAFTPV